jgi:hypothetical protein
VAASDGSDWGCHDCDVNLALGNLLAVNAVTEATWTRSAPLGAANPRSARSGPVT